MFLNEKINTLYKNYSIFFTDASKQAEEQPVGLAIYEPLTQNSEIYQISKHASIFTAEALAILLTLERIGKNNIKKAVIFTDSRSTVQSLNNKVNSSSNETLFEIKSLLQKLIKKEGKKIIISWIPSHIRISGNEKADFLAKKAITDGIYLEKYFRKYLR